MLWYGLMFNAIRWAMPAYLLFLSTACLSFMALADRALSSAAGKAAVAGMSGTIARHVPFSSPHHGIHRAGLFAAIGLLGLTCVAAFGYFASDRVIPRSLDRDLIRVALGQSTIEQFLNKTREGYTLYRYIGTHDLRKVWQPFDNGAEPYSAAYNGGRDGKWLLYSVTLPPDESGLDDFLREEKIRYFITRPSVTDTEIDRFTRAYVEKCMRFFAILIPRSQLILTDSFGWSLYKINEPPADRESSQR
jgi:hypothetical protein